MRLAVISQFVDRHHGTEAALAALLFHLSRDHRIDVHLYSQRVDDLELDTSEPMNEPRGRIEWHRVPSIPGPHVAQYVFWYFANTYCRWRDRFFRGGTYDLVYSPGINSSDADVITVHIVFRAFYDKTKPFLRFRTTPVRQWPVMLHRLCYYRLAMWLEKRIYPRETIKLSAVSDLVSRQLRQYYGRSDARVTMNGVDVSYFNPENRLRRRLAARSIWSLSDETYVFLLIGNDWKKKGLDNTLAALSKLRLKDVMLLVVGDDVRAPYQEMANRLGIQELVKFLPVSDSVIDFYAAADTYISASLEDAFGLPIIESMACGLPAIASSEAGASEIIRDGENGFILNDPRNVDELCLLMRRLIQDRSLGARIGVEAAKTAKRQDWARQATQIIELLCDASKTRVPDGAASTRGT